MSIMTDKMQIIEELHTKIENENLCAVSMHYSLGNVYMNGKIDTFEFHESKLYFNIDNFIIDFEDCLDVTLEDTPDGISYNFKFDNVNIVLMFLN